MADDNLLTTREQRCIRGTLHVGMGLEGLFTDSSQRYKHSADCAKCVLTGAFTRFVSHGQNLLMADDNYS